MQMGELINKTFTVPVLAVPYYGPTLAERTKNMKMDQGFKRSKAFLERREAERVEKLATEMAIDLDSIPTS